MRRQAVWTLLFLAILLAWGKPVYAQNQSVRATEVSAVLADASDRHFFGLETIQPGQAVAVTLHFEAADLAAQEDVNFVVLSEDGVARFLAGAHPEDVAVAVGTPLLFDPEGNRRSALVPGVQTTGFTVIVTSSASQPVRYSLQVQGGMLRDDAGQSQSSVMVDTSGTASPAAVDVMESAKPVHVVKPADAAPEQVTQVRAVPARRLTGVLAPHSDRHYLRLMPDGGSGEVSLTLHYVAHDAAHSGKLNIWVLTQEGARHLDQGGLIEELNLAVGSPVMSLAGATVMRTTLRVAESVPYVVVVYNQMGEPADYIINVEGAVVVDERGQTHEAQAAVAEALALGW